MKTQLILSVIALVTFGSATVYAACTTEDLIKMKEANFSLEKIQKFCDLGGPPSPDVPPKPPQPCPTVKVKGWFPITTQGTMEGFGNGSTQASACGRAKYDASENGSACEDSGTFFGEYDSDEIRNITQSLNGHCECDDFRDIGQGCTAEKEQYRTKTVCK